MLVLSERAIMNVNAISISAPINYDSVLYACRLSTVFPTIFCNSSEATYRKLNGRL
jgi:hypothetical protein